MPVGLSSVLWIGGTRDIPQRKIRDTFVVYGEIVSNVRCPGFVCIEYKLEESCDEARRDWDQKELDGSSLHLRTIKIRCYMALVRRYRNPERPEDIVTTIDFSSFVIFREARNVREGMTLAPPTDSRDCLQICRHGLNCPRRWGAQGGCSFTHLPSDRKPDLNHHHHQHHQTPNNDVRGAIKRERRLSNAQKETKESNTSSPPKELCEPVQLEWHLGLWYGRWSNLALSYGQRVDGPFPLPPFVLPRPSTSRSRRVKMRNKNRRHILGVANAVIASLNTASGAPTPPPQHFPLTEPQLSFRRHILDVCTALVTAPSMLNPPSGPPQPLWSGGGGGTMSIPLSLPLGSGLDNIALRIPLHLPGAPVHVSMSLPVPVPPPRGGHGLPHSAHHHPHQLSPPSPIFVPSKPMAQGGLFPPLAASFF